MIWILFCHEKLKSVEQHLKIGEEFQGVTWPWHQEQHRWEPWLPQFLVAWPWVNSLPLPSTRPAIRNVTDGKNPQALSYMFTGTMQGELNAIHGARRNSTDVYRGVLESGGGGIAGGCWSVRREWTAPSGRGNWPSAWGGRAKMVRTRREVGRKSFKEGRLSGEGGCRTNGKDGEQEGIRTWQVSQEGSISLRDLVAPEWVSVNELLEGRKCRDGGFRKQPKRHKEGEGIKGWGWSVAYKNELEPAPEFVGAGRTCLVAIFFILDLFIVRVEVRVCHSMRVEVRVQLSRIFFLLPSCWSQGSNSGLIKSSSLAVECIPAEPSLLACLGILIAFLEN